MSNINEGDRQRDRRTAEFDESENDAIMKDRFFPGRSGARE